MKKNFKLALALVLALSLFASMSAMAASITINRDNTYDTNATGDRVYTWYKIFSASYTTNQSSASGPANADGTPLTVTETASNASYKATTTVAAVLGSYSGSTFTPASGNNWFDIAPIAGDSAHYTVFWRNGVTVTPAVTQDAAEWLITNHAYETSGTMTFSNNSWTLTNADAGYYVIDSATSGKNLIAATTDIVINEKNAYPTITKKELDPEVANATYSQTAPIIGVGDAVNYQVTVHVPGDADQDIVVTDTMSTGLTFNDDMSVKIGNTTLTEDTDYVVGTPATGETWKYTIKPNNTTKNQDVVFEFTATVTEAAIVNQKKNDVALDYGNYHATDTVPYKMYKTAAYKYDGADYTEELSNVVFTLKEDGTEFKVSQHADGYYYPDATSGNADVTTNSNGLIIIRGLDNDKIYTLTEKSNPYPEYNMVTGDVTLTLIEDTATDSTAYTPTVGTQLSEKGTEVAPIANNKGVVLPSTGGIGTTIFYVAGSLMVLAAAILLITKRRMGAND